MGHIVNACGFRLGWALVWENLWYSSIDLYVKIFTACMRVRAVLKFLLFRQEMDKSDFIFSHFNILKIINNIMIRIFVYFIPLSSLMTGLFEFIWDWVSDDAVPKRIQRKSWKYSLFGKTYTKIVEGESNEKEVNEKNLTSFSKYKQNIDNSDVNFKKLNLLKSIKVNLKNNTWILNECFVNEFQQFSVLPKIIEVTCQDYMMLSHEQVLNFCNGVDFKPFLKKMD